MMSTTLPLPSASTRATPESWEMVSRSFAPLPFIALAALSMKRETEVPLTPLCGPRSVASRMICSLTSSHSTGTAVRSSGMTALSAMVGPLVR